MSGWAQREAERKEDEANEIDELITENRELTAERDALRAELEKVRCELDDAEERASEAEERCAAEWEKDCGQALRILAQVTKFEWDQDGSPADEVREHIQITIESLEKQLLSLRAELAAAKEERTAIAAHVERLVGALECVPVDLIHAIENGDTGANVFLSAGSCKLIGAALAATPAQSLEAVTAPLKAHVEQLEKGLRVARELTREEPDIYVVGIRRVIDELIAATPAQSLAAHDAATKEPSPFLSRAAWRVVKEIWIDVAAGRMNARSAVADAALDLRGLLEESGPEPADDVVGVGRKAETTFGGYLAAHDAALLREVAKRFAYRRNDGDWTIHPDSLTDEADRIAGEAPHA